MDSIQALRQSSLFHFLSEQDREEIIKKSGGTATFKKGKQLFLEGDIANYFYIVLEGRIQISRQSIEGKKVVLKDMLQGDSFAEIILFEENKYPATATAEEDSIVLRLDKKQFRKHLENKKINEAFILNLLKKLRFLARKVELFNNAKVSDRFYHFIETYYGKKERFIIKESKKEIASKIGTIPETFSRMISKLKKKGTILSWNKRELILEENFWNKYETKS